MGDPLADEGAAVQHEGRPLGGTMDSDRPQVGASRRYGEQTYNRRIAVVIAADRSPTGG
jgi:hypothetical protein